MATANKKTPTPVDSGEPLVDMIALHDYHYGNGKRATPGTPFQAPLTEVDWLLENGVAKLVGK